ncbi:MAG: peptidylprolyl isomerase [Bacteroidales bacterium]
MRTLAFKLLLSSAMFYGALNVSAKEDPAVLKIGKQEVKLSEFEYIYKKNAGVQGVEKVSFDEYVKMFTDFKLKVHEAIELRLDTLPQLKQELEGYRQQLAQGYLTDKEVDDRLLKEAYDRMKENVEVSHILIMLPEGATPQDTLAAYQKIQNLYDRTQKGDDFATLAKEFSSCPSKKDGGYLGYLKAFMTVYPFESCAYNTPTGQISKPVRTQFGYHLVKVHNRREDQGTFTLAHIFKQFRYNTTPEQKQAMQDELKGLKQQIDNGAGFDELASDFSDDSRTRDRGGVLPAFSTGEVPNEVYEAALTLKEPGDVSDVVITGQGAHLFKLVRKQKIGSFEEEKDRIQQQIMRDQRSNKGKESFVSKLKTDYAVRVNESILKDLFIFPVDSQVVNKAKSIKEHLLTIGTTVFTASDYVDFANSISNGYPLSRKVEDLLNVYVDKSVMDYESSQLDKKYSDFRNLMQEYRDGVLLFEISNRKVWDKAGKDTEGLDKFFAKNIKKYKLNEPHFKGYVLECTNDSVMAEVKSLLNENYSDSIVTHIRRKFNVKQNIVKVQRVMAKRGDSPVVDQLMFEGKEYIPSGEYPFVAVQGKILNDYPESYLDIRGAVTADYQDYLEQEWLKDLRKKYKVKLNRNIIKTVKE